MLTGANSPKLYAVEFSIIVFPPFDMNFMKYIYTGRICTVSPAGLEVPPTRAQVG